MDRNGLEMRALAMTDFNYFPHVERPATTTPTAEADAPGLWNRVKCVVLCWWHHSCYDREWVRTREQWQCVCRRPNWRIPLFWVDR